MISKKMRIKIIIIRTATYLQYLLILYWCRVPVHMVPTLLFFVLKLQYCTYVFVLHLLACFSIILADLGSLHHCVIVLVREMSLCPSSSCLSLLICLLYYRRQYLYLCAIFHGLFFCVRVPSKCQAESRVGTVPMFCSRVRRCDLSFVFLFFVFMSVSCSIICLLCEMVLPTTSSAISYHYLARHKVLWGGFAFLAPPFCVRSKNLSFSNFKQILSDQKPLPANSKSIQIR